MCEKKTLKQKFWYIIGHPFRLQNKELEIAGGQDGMTEKCKIMKHLEVVFLAVIVVIYPFLFAIIYEMRHIRRRSRDLPLFPAPSDSLSRRLNIRIRGWVTAFLGG